VTQHEINYMTPAS